MASAHVYFLVQYFKPFVALPLFIVFLVAICHLLRLTMTVNAKQNQSNKNDTIFYTPEQS